MADWYKMGVMAPMSVIGLQMISSPGSGSTAATAVCTAAVPEVVVRQNGSPSHLANRVSNSRTIVPFVQLRVPDWITRLRSASSSSPKDRPLLSPSDGSTSLVLDMLTRTLLLGR